MVSYPDLSSLNNASGIGGILSLPNASYPYFWAWILGGLWCIMVLTMYFKEKEKTGFGKILSSMAVSSFTIVFLATIGTIVGFISVDIMIRTLVFCCILIGIWWFTTKD